MRKIAAGTFTNAAPETIDAVRPRMRRDAIVTAHPGGALLRTATATAWLTGPQAYPVLMRLSPVLSGERSVGSICAGLGPRAAGLTRALIRELLERGIVIDAGWEPREGQFDAQRGYLAHLTGSPEQAFRRFREARVLLVGQGDSLRACAATLLRNGATGLRIGDRDDLGVGHGLVLYCADRHLPAGVELVRAYRELGPGRPPMLAMAVTGGRALVGSPTEPGEDLWAAVDPAVTGDPPSLTGLTARRLGVWLAFEAFRFLTGITDGRLPAVVAQDVRTLRTRSAAAVPVPRRMPAKRGPSNRGAFESGALRGESPSSIVRSYADAVHHMVRAPLNTDGFGTTPGELPDEHTWRSGTALVSLPEPVPPIQSPFEDQVTKAGRASAYTLDTLSWMLRTAYGRLGLRARIDSTHAVRTHGLLASATWSRGPVSGGGLYPLEMYWVMGEHGPLPPGVYHYAAGHHALEPCALGDAGDRIRAAVRHGEADRSDHFLAISVRFWRNGFKYANLAYHLSTLDLGALLSTFDHLGRGAGSPVRRVLWFDDERVNAVLGLDPEQESVMALVPLPWRDDGARLTVPTPPPAAPVLRPLVPRIPWTRHVHRAGLLSAQARPAPRRPQGAPVPPAAGELIALPRPTGARSGEPVSALLARRRSSFGGFVADPPLEPEQLGSVLTTLASMKVYQDDLTGDDQPTGWTGLSVLVNHVAGVTPGGYRYDPVAHGLRTAPSRAPVEPWPDVLARIGRRLTNYTLDQVAVVVVISGWLDDLIDRYGPRGYRLLNAEAGSVLQTGCLAATAAGLGAGPS